MANACTCWANVLVIPIAGRGGGVGHDVDARASLLAWAPLFLDEAAFEHYEETLCTISIGYLLVFLKMVWLLL